MIYNLKKKNSQCIQILLRELYCGERIGLVMKRSEFQKTSQLYKALVTNTRVPFSVMYFDLTRASWRLRWSYERQIKHMIQKRMLI